MLKIILFWVCLLNAYQLFSISIADFTVKYQKNEKYYNFYDDPALLFETLNKKNNLDLIKTGDNLEYKFDDCFFTVFSLEFDNISQGILYQIQDQYNVINPNHYYCINYFEAYENFSTIRGIAIGDDVKKVLETYPEAVLYKNNGKYKWELSDCYHESKITKTKKISEIGYVLLETAYWQYNRSFEVDWPVHYELVFVIKDSIVKSIVMQCIIDAM